MLLDVPYFKQDTAYTCGPASVQMLLRYVGITVSEQELARELMTDHVYGTHHEKIIRTLTARGLHVYVNNNASLEDITMWLEKGLPALIHYIEPSQNEGHYAIVVGYEKSHVILNDPWNGERFRIGEREFLERWHDEADLFHQWYLVVSKADFTMGRHYAPQYEIHSAKH